MNALQNKSFLQDQRHLSKTETFVPVCPKDLATFMDSFGFDLVHLKVGRARKPDRVEHQTTFARYRSRDLFDIQGLFYDIIVKVPHLYGAIEVRSGLFRGACANQWALGQLFERFKVRHVGDPISELNGLIPQVVAQREAIVDSIRAMCARTVSPNEIAELAKQVADLRLDGLNAKNVQLEALVKPHRSEDMESNLFTVINVLQENVMRYGLKYQVESQRPDGSVYFRNQTARPVMRNRSGEIETQRSLDLNGSIWDLASNLLKQTA